VDRARVAYLRVDVARRATTSHRFSSSLIAAPASGP
jgi:hypothetical protein